MRKRLQRQKAGIRPRAPRYQHRPHLRTTTRTERRRWRTGKPTSFLGRLLHAIHRAHLGA